MGFNDPLRGLRQIWAFDNRWQLVLDRLLFRRNGLTVYRIGEFTILVDHGGGDEAGTREVLVSSMYRDLLPLMELVAPLNVLDLGANGGGFPLLLRLAGLDIRRAVCVEMNRQTTSRLRFNLDRNIPGRCIVLNRAISADGRSVNVPLGSGGTSDNIYTGNTRARGQASDIKGATFDRVVARYFPESLIDVCKIDVEGAEEEIVCASTASLLRRCRYVIMEIHGEAAQAVLPAMSAHGFIVLRGGGSRRDSGVHLFRQEALTPASDRSVR